MKKKQGGYVTAAALGVVLAVILGLGVTVLAQSRALGGARAAADAAAAIYDGNLRRAGETNRGYRDQLAYMRQDAERRRAMLDQRDREVRALRRQLSQAVENLHDAEKQDPACAAFAAARMCARQWDIVRNPAAAAAVDRGAAGDSARMPGPVIPSTGGPDPGKGR